MSVKLKYSEEGTVQKCIAYTGENFSDENKNIVSENSFDLASIPAEVQAQLTMYGFKKILQDRNSDLKGEEKIAGMGKTYEQLCSGQFTAPREGGGSSKPRRKKIDPFLAQAVATLTGNDILAVTTALEIKDKDELKALEEHEQIAAKMAELREAAANVEIDLSI